MLSEFVNESDARTMLIEKWKSIIDEPSSPKIASYHRKAVTAMCLENVGRQTRSNAEGIGGGTVGMLSEEGHSASASGIDYIDPILIPLIRRAMPNLMAYDVCGVQPLSNPTGLIFSLRARYGTEADAPDGTYSDDGGFNRIEALFNEADPRWGGGRGTLGWNHPTSGFSTTQVEGSIQDLENSLADGAGGGDLTGIDGIEIILSGTETARSGEEIQSLLQSGTRAGERDYLGSGGAYSRNQGENLGTTDEADNQIRDMGITIERTGVQAIERKLRARYSIEMAQDLKATHGLDAEAELTNILSTELLAEINRHVVGTIYQEAKLGAQHSNFGVKGIFDMMRDGDGRWLVERFKGLVFQLEREANIIAKETRRGRGNFIICSSDVASALAASGMLDYAPAMSTSLNVDDTGNTFVGILNGKLRVYIDPYSIVGKDFVVVGYKGSSSYDAGLFYCPYVPLTLLRAVREQSLQPTMGFMTRYGMVSNPFVDPGNARTQNAPDEGFTGIGGRFGTSNTAGKNQYYRLFAVRNLMESQQSLL